MDKRTARPGGLNARISQTKQFRKGDRSRDAQRPKPAGVAENEVRKEKGSVVERIIPASRLSCAAP